MQTQLAEFIRHTHQGKEADAILRSCVHCGFCTATCPTYQLLGDELDGPRGRIYQIKEVLEGQPASVRIREHLDRCLTCRACETTCPSGVQYGRLLDIGRATVERQTRRPLLQRLQRQALLRIMPYPARISPLLKLAHALRPLLPPFLRQKVPAITPAAPVLSQTHTRRMLMLDGCVQSATNPGINGAATRLLNRLGIQLSVAPQVACCGALAHHLSAEAQARETARRNIDAWLPELDAGAEAILITASGCAVHLKDYGHLLADDPAYADKARRVAHAAKDPVEILEQEDLAALAIAPAPTPLAFHSPCTLQHGEKLPGRVEALLTRLGFQLTPVPDAHLCCGSAGTYSLLQPEISSKLRENKLRALNSGSPAQIATANIGCLMHLQEHGGTPVQHWLEVLVERMDSAR